VTRPGRLLFLAEGISIHSVRWIRYFAQAGWSVDWISLTPVPVGTDLGGARFHLVPSRGGAAWRAWQAVRMARAIIRDRRPDVLHSHYAGTYGVIGALCRFHPFVVTGWGSDVLLAPNSPWKKVLVQHVLRSADLITCDAGHMQQAIVTLGADPSRVRIVYFGTDTALFHPDRASQDWRARFGLGSAPVVISLRTLHPVYDVESLIRAVPAVLARVPEARVVIGGDGPDRPHLESVVAALGVGHAVTFIGFVLGPDLPATLASADVYVSTSTSDGGIAATTAEAMACGVPVVITDFGENRDWVEDGVSGRIVPLRSPDKVAEAVIALLGDAAMRRELGARGRQVIDTRNNYAREMARMGALYAELAGEVS
jgi:L-malate glycosyltransferase